MLFIAMPVGVIMIIAFGTWCLLMKVTEGIRYEMAQRSLKEEHMSICVQMDDEYKKCLHSIEIGNTKLLDAWKAANEAKMAEHALRCKAIDAENRPTIAPWETAKAAIEADHQRLTPQVEQANCRILLNWETENNARQMSHDQARRKIELENQFRISDWNTRTAECQAEHRKKCDEIDAKNRQIIAEWEVANAPWLNELKRWRERAAFAEATLRRLEDEFVSHRRVTISNFQQRKADVECMVKSHDGVMQDYDLDFRNAEMDSMKVQLEEYLDKSLIRPAKLKGITGERILSLESFGIETAKDIPMLNHHKVPGIGSVLKKRLFDWRDKLVLSFRPKQGLPESERRRVATRYAPALLPLREALQSAIKDLEGIAASHRASEDERIKAVAATVQDLAVAEAYVQAMMVVV